MEGVLLLILVLVGLALFDIAVDRLGVDSREGSYDFWGPTAQPLS